MSQGREAVIPAAAEGETLMPAAPGTAAAASAESFDALMNFLLDAGQPMSAVMPVAEAPSAPPLPLPEGTDAAFAGGGEADTVPDVVADLERFVECLPGPPEVTSLPANGKNLPGLKLPVAGEPATDAPPVDISPVVAVTDTPVTASAPACVPEPAIARVDDDGANDIAGEPPVTAMVPPVMADTLPPATSAAGNEAQAPVAESDDTQAVAVSAVDTPLPSPPPPLPELVAAMPAGDTADEVSPRGGAPAAYDAAGIRMNGSPRTDAAAPPRSDAPLSPVTADASGNRAATQDGDAQSLGRTPEWLAKLGADATGRPAADGFRGLLQAAEGSAPAQAAALTYAQAGTTGPARDTTVPSLPVYTPLRHPDWGDEVGQRVRWVIGSQLQTAELKINPPHLGPMEVRISMDADRQLNVTLSSQHVLVREALQDSLPRLRDLMSDQGFGAVNVDVSQHSFADSRGAAAQAGRDTAPSARGEDAADADVAVASRREVRGLVDLYA